MIDKFKVMCEYGAKDWLKAKVDFDCIQIAVKEKYAEPNAKHEIAMNARTARDLADWLYQAANEAEKYEGIWQFDAEAYDYGNESNVASLHKRLNESTNIPDIIA